MNDRRAFPANGRVAHVSVRDQCESPRFTDGETRRVCLTVAPLFASPDPGHRRRDRELVLHEAFRVLEQGPGWAFGFAERDGYVGYMHQDALGPDIGPMTHVVAARQSYLSPAPILKNSDAVEPVSFGTRLRVHALHETGRWAEVARLRGTGDDGADERTVFVPAGHLRPLNHPEDDPAAVAERFLGTPYHWGGNSAFGIDCSGLMQAAFHACGLACPGDSDQQANRLGQEIPADAPVQRGDLFFWRGHVAMATGSDTLIHANAHHMAVVAEGLAQAIARITAQGDGPVTLRRRVG